MSDDARRWFAFRGSRFADRVSRIVAAEAVVVYCGSPDHDPVNKPARFRHICLPDHGRDHVTGGLVNALAACLDGAAL
jgi:hypothetical protein